MGKAGKGCQLKGHFVVRWHVKVCTVHTREKKGISTLLSSYNENLKKPLGKQKRSHSSGRFERAESTPTSAQRNNNEGRHIGESEGDPESCLRP